MEYRHKKQEPVTTDKRQARRAHARVKKNSEQESQRRRAAQGEQTDELGVTQGQNGEQGNSFNPVQSTDIGRRSQP